MGAPARGCTGQADPNMTLPQQNTATSSPYQVQLARELLEENARRNSATTKAVLPHSSWWMFYPRIFTGHELADQ